MSNGPREISSGTNFGSVRAPGFIEQPLAGAANAAQNQAFGGGPESFVQSQGRNLVGQTLRGDFLTPGSNPFLQGVADNIGDTVFNQTAQRFAGAGRNPGGADAQGVFRRDLTNQLSPMFAQNFANERQLQNQTLGMSSQFDPLNQLISRLGLLAPAAGRETFQESFGRSEQKLSPFDRLVGGLDALF